MFWKSKKVETYREAHSDILIMGPEIVKKDYSSPWPVKCECNVCRMLRTSLTFEKEKTGNDGKSFLYSSQYSIPFCYNEKQENLK